MTNLTEQNDVNGKKNYPKQCNQIKDKFPDYLTGELPPDAVNLLRGHAATCTSCQLEQEELTGIWAQLGLMPEEVPGPNLRKNFYTMLESYCEEQKKESSLHRFMKSLTGFRFQSFQPAYRLAATVVILILGFAAGYYFNKSAAISHPQSTVEMAQLQNQVQEMRQDLVLAMLDQSSASQRLKAISWSATIQNPADKTLDALLYTLNNDPNMNVRLSAVEALYLFAENPRVKQGIIDSLSHQTSPLVQMALIDLMVEMREKRAAYALKQLIENKNLNPQVKQRAKLAVKFL